MHALKYINLRDDYVYMRYIHLNMQCNYVDMQLIYIV